MNNAQEILASRVQRLSFVSFGEEEKQAEPVVEVIEEEKVVEPYMLFEPPKIITEEEVKAAKNEGYQQGYKEGTAAAQTKIDEEAAKREESVKSLLETIANRITLAAEEQAAYRETKQTLLNNLVIAAARKVAGDAMKSEPYAAVENLLRECLALIIEETKIIITVPQSLSDGLKQRIDTMRALMPGFSGELIVETGSEMGDNNCRVEWKNGYGERDTAKLWNEIETIITKMGTI